MSVIPEYYWDTVCFLGLLKEEQDKFDRCLSFMNEAEKGTLRIITSALTIAEVITLKGSPRQTQESSKIIYDFFLRDFITVIGIDRKIAEKARDLLWEHPSLLHKDAIHVASAVYAGIPVFNTYDGALINLSDKIGQPPLLIEKPTLPQGGLALK